MKLDFNRRYTTIAFYAFLVLSGAGLFAAFLQNFPFFKGFFLQIFTLLRPFIYGFGIAYILNPVLKFVESILAEFSGSYISSKPRRAIAICLTYLLAAGVIAIFIMIMLPQLVNSVTGLVNRMVTFLNSTNRDMLMNYILSFSSDMDISTALWDYISQYADKIIQTTYSLITSRILPVMTNITTGLASGLLNVVVGIIVSIYMLADKERFGAGMKRIWYAVLPSSKADWILELAGDANHVFGGFISGKLLDSLIIGIICFFGMTFLNRVLPFAMPSAMLISVIVGLTNIIPYFGPFIGAIPSFFIILIESPKGAFVFLLFIFALQQFDGNILGPKILGDSTGLSAFWVVFSITLFGGLYGFVGMFLGVPVFSVIFMLLNRLVRANLVKRGMPLELDDYCAPDAPLLKAKEKGKKRRGLRRAHTVKPLSPEESEKQARQERDRKEKGR
ncbi:MAG: AI-2E family transporter [Oscillospiraceae bacterium]|nr:AI-2E family transporter [Oscillospiraceae bacterium]